MEHSHSFQHICRHVPDQLSLHHSKKETLENIDAGLSLMGPVAQRFLKRFELMLFPSIDAVWLPQ